MRRFPLQLAFIPFIVALATGDGVGQGTLTKGVIHSGDRDREFWTYLPRNYSAAKKMPLVLAFHGGGGSAHTTIRHYNFNPLADEEGFIVVYPDGVDRGWNDGRIAPRKSSTANDVQFVSDLIDYLVTKQNVDSRRIFATGISNGAIFSIYLALKIPDKILAIAPVCGSLPENLEKEFTLSKPVSILVINGTADPLVPYSGGPVVSERAGRGSVLGTEKTINLWLRSNGCTSDPKVDDVPDDANDNCRASRRTWTCSDSSTVVLIKIDGGGHTWPGGKQYAPRLIVGEVCRDFDAEKVIWEFFKKQKQRM